ncbi:hypothetical protein QR680_018492 [Steinernema hermaphroditum]|nr:hypothetical protein QR680_018492 [Steinernema hermaphroditum]
MAPFIVCTGCRFYLYCCYEHQVLDFPCHRVFCLATMKALMKCDQLCSADTPAPVPSTVTELIHSYRTYPMKDHTKIHAFNKSVRSYCHDLKETNARAINVRIEEIIEHILNSLLEYGWALVDNFLGETGSNAVFCEIETLYQSNAFSASQIGGYTRGGLVDSSQRSDQVFSFDKSTECTKNCHTLHALVRVLDVMAQSFGPDFPYKITSRSNPVLSVYHRNQARYVKHVDNPVGDGRCLTCIYYCNSNWDIVRHGGNLTLYPESSETPIPVAPINDRLIFFWSDRRNPHEVKPAFRDRFAMTIWYMDSAQKADVHRRRQEDQQEKRKSQVVKLTGKEDKEEQDAARI